MQYDEHEHIRCYVISMTYTRMTNETLNETKLCRVDQSLSILTFMLFLKRGDKSFAKMALKMQFALHEGVDCTFRYCQ